MQVEYNNTLVNQQIITTAYHSFKGTFGPSKKVSNFVLVHPVGTETNCFFDPNDPTTAVFNFDQNVGAVVGIVFGAVFIFIGFVLLLGGIMNCIL